MDANTSTLLFGLQENDVQLVRKAVTQGASLTSPADPSDPERLTPLMLAAKWGYVEVCRALIDLGADPHYSIHNDLKITAIGTAAYYGQKEVCRLLTELGATTEEIEVAIELARAGANSFGQGSRASKYSDTINTLLWARDKVALPNTVTTLLAGNHPEN